MAQFPNDTSASGIWTLKKQKRAIQGENWPGRPVYIEDVFNTYLTTGTGSAITVVNGIDLATKGGLVWNKTRSALGAHSLFDTARGVNQLLASNATSQQQLASDTLTAFNSNGFVVGASNNIAAAGVTGVSWTFRKQAKFFDIVTYTGDGSYPRSIAHNLGSVPGCVIIKKTDSSQSWIVWHRSFSNTAADYLLLEQTSAVASNANTWGSMTSTTFGVNSYSGCNTNGGTYVAYLFAHDAGGFGPSAADNAISCGSYTTDGSGNATISLGYEPQWLLIKKTTGAADNWWIQDIMRGMPVRGQAGKSLNPNTSSAEANATLLAPTATGFVHQSYQASSTFIYIAIRRGPMKTPTTGTSVFSPNAYSTTGVAGNPQTTGFPVDWMIQGNRSGGSVWPAGFSRLQGGSQYLQTSSTAAEATQSGGAINFDSNTNFSFVAQWFNNGAPSVSWSFRRAPGFFDVVCYTGTGVAMTVPHNLGAVPQLIIVKTRNYSSYDWKVQPLSNPLKRLLLNSTGAEITPSIIEWNDTAPTATVFSVGGGGDGINQSGGTYVAYLFASCPGVSKVGSYTGTGALQTINCGFTSGARWVMIKRTDSTGDWWVYDSARGITSGNDPYLLMNSTAAEVTGTNYVDTTSVGFQVTAAAPAGLNASGGTYIFLAIA